MRAAIHNLCLATPLGVLLCLAFAASVAWAEPTDKSTVPAEYRAFVEQCEKYEQMLHAKSWKPTFQRLPADGDVSTETMSVVEDDAKLEVGDHVLRLIAGDNHPALLKVGPKVSGDFAVEYEARITGQRLYHMSIVVDQRNHGPGFVFGGDDNQVNKLFTDASPTSRGIGAVELPRDVLLERNRWTTVRMEVQDGIERGYVDGRLLGGARLNKAYDPARQCQVMLYTYGTTMEIRRISFQTIRDAQPEDADKAFSKVFGNMTRDQVDQRIAALVKQLDADDWPTRQQANELLGHIGALARPALEQATKTGSAEQRWRAYRLLGGQVETHQDADPEQPDLNW